MEPAGEAERGRAREEDGEPGGEPGGSSSSGDSDSETLASRMRKVSFADAFGLNLVSVKEFSSRAPGDEESVANPNANGPDSEEYFLRSQFSVPASTSDLLAKLRAQMCELECVELLPGTATLRGIIRVFNLCYDKTVCVRTSLDGWGTHFDLPAHFVPGSSDGETDRFAFSLDLTLPFPPDGARVEFCLRYETPLGTFWANNSGVNYVLVCQRRGGRDGRGRRCEDSSLRNKKSCLKHNSKEKSTEANPPVISAETPDVPVNKQEVAVSKKTEKPASISDDLQDDSCQKSLVASGRNLSRRSRRRVARLAQIRDRFYRTAAGAQRGDAPAQDSRDADGRTDTDTDAEISTPLPEGDCGIWDWNQTDWEEQEQTHDEIPQQSPQLEAERLPLSLAYGSTDSSAYAAARVSHTPQGEFWDSTAPQGTPGDSDTPWGAPRDSDAPQEALLESAASLSEVATGHENSESPQAMEEDPSAQEQAFADISTSVQDYLGAVITGGKDGVQRHSHLISGDRASTEGQDSNDLWPQSDWGRDKFKFETFVAPLYHQAFCRSRPESQDITGELWAGDQASDDSDDEGSTGSCSRLTAIVNAQPLFPFGSYTPPVDQLGRDLGDILESAPGNSMSTDTHVSAQEQQVYGQENATLPFLENSGPGAEITSHDRVHRAAGYGAEIISDGDVPPAAEIGRQDKEPGEHLFTPKAVEGIQILAEAETKTDATATIATLASSATIATLASSATIATLASSAPIAALASSATIAALASSATIATLASSATIATLASSNTNATRGDGSRMALLPLSANTETEVKGDELRGDCVIFTQGVGETGFFSVLMEKKVSLDEGKMVSAEKEEEFNKTEAVSVEYQGLYGEWLIKNEDLDDEVSMDAQLDKDVSVENDLDNDEVSVEDEELYGDNLKENEDLGVSVEYENINDDEVPVEEAIDKFLSAKNEYLDDDEVSVEDEEPDKNTFVENEDLYGDNLTENEDLDSEELTMEDAELVRDVSVGNEDLYGDNLKENEDLGVSVEYENINDDEVSVEEEMDKFRSAKNEDLDEVSVEDEEPNKNILVENEDLYDDNLTENEDLDSEELTMEDAELVRDVSVGNEDLYGDNLKENEDLGVSVEHEGINDDEVSVEEEIDKYLSAKNKDLDDDKLSVGDEELDRDISVENKDLYGETVNNDNDDRLPVENKDLDNEASLKDEDLDEEALSMGNGDEAGEEAPVSKDLDEVKSKTSPGQKDDLYDEEEVFFIETKDEHRDGESEILQEIEDLDEGVGVVFGEQECGLWTDLKADALIGEDVHLHVDRTVPGGESERDVREAGEVYKEDGKQSEDGGERQCEENPETEEDSVSTDSLTDDEMELHMRSVKSAHEQQPCRPALGNGRAAAPIGGGKRPSLSRARIPPTALSSISESPNEDGDALPEEEEKEESGLAPAETAGDCSAIKLPPVEKVENAARTYLSSWRETFSLGNLWRAGLYALLCALFFFTAYHYDFLACFALYLFSVFWLCFPGEKQGLQGAKREK